MYKEDLNIPKELFHPEMEQIEKDFQEWYHTVMQCNCSPKSARYYQMFRAWKGSKEYYLKSKKMINTGKDDESKMNQLDRIETKVNKVLKYLEAMEME